MEHIILAIYLKLCYNKLYKEGFIWEKWEKECIHRNVFIFTDEQGIWVDGYLELFLKLTQTQNFIDKKHDGSNKKELQQL